MSVKNLWIMCGASGSGKSYFATHNLKTDEHVCYISRDAIRYFLISDNDQYFSKENIVFSQFTKAIREALDNDNYTDVIADATHLNWGSRRKLLNALGLNIKPDNINIIPVWVTCDMNIILERNDQREGRARVPGEEIIKMIGRMRHPRSDPYKYTAIMEVYNQ